MWRREVPPPRRLTAREQYLPWAMLSLSGRYPWVNRPAIALGIPAAVVACSRAVNAGSCPDGLSPDTVARPANSPPDAGGAGIPVSATGPRRRANNAAATRPDAIAAADNSGRLAPSPSSHPAKASRNPPRSSSSLHRPPNRPPPPRSAWASAQTELGKNPGACPAIDRAATSSSSPRHGPLGSTSVLATVARRYDASDSGKRGCNSAAAMVVDGSIATIVTHPSATPLMSSRIEYAPRGGLPFHCPQ
jgi:hypothetical protein